MDDGWDSDGARPPPAGMFFVANEPEPVAIEEDQVEAPEPESLFLPDDREESARPASPFASPQKSKRTLAVMDSDDEKDEIVELPSDVYEKGAASSSSSRVSSVPSSPPTLPSRAESLKPPPSKKRKVLPGPVASGSTKKEEEENKSYFFGNFLIGNAWSTAKGKGYISIGDNFLVQRDAPKSAAPAKGKAAGKKQATLSSMLKPAKAGKAKRKEVDHIVRLNNMRGFEFGRLPLGSSSAHGKWISQLMDMDMIEFKGNTMIDCPDVLAKGNDLIVSLSVYVKASAFEARSSLAGSDELSNVMFNEGIETTDEQMLRERKSSLLALFEAVNLRPNKGADPAKAAQIAKMAKGKQPAAKPKETLQADIKGKGKAKQEVIDVDGDDEDEDKPEDEDEKSPDSDDEEALDDNELDMIYRKAQANDREMEEMEPPDTFTLTLRGYQKQALRWMHSLETGVMSAREASSIHPLWAEYIFPTEPKEGVIDLTAEESPFYFNPYSGELSLSFPKAERKCKGGILADEMGMGKTIMLSALIQTNPEESREEYRADTSAPKNKQLKLGTAFKPSAKQKKAAASGVGPRATLIVAPTSLLNQWAEELERSSKPGTVEVTVWHGTNRVDLYDATTPDDEDDETIRVVVTSYGVLASEHAKTLKAGSTACPAFEIEWLRVVLDEAHHCKSRTSKSAKAVFALRARRRWAVTGTPLVNKLEDLYSLLKFLGFAPWSDYAFFRACITLPFLNRDPKAIEIVQVILESILLRREKNMLDSDGKRIVDLPGKEIVIEELEFSHLERKIYDSIYNDAKKDFERLNDKGLVSKNYTHILAMIMRLRRAVLHPNLVLSPEQDEDSTKVKSKGTVDVDAMIRRFADEENKEGSSNGKFAQEALANIDLEDTDECPICMDVIDSPSLVPGCMHKFCKDCIVGYLADRELKGEEGVCPSCMGPVVESDLLEIRAAQAPTNSQPDPKATLVQNNFRSSTKLNGLVKDLRRLRDQDPCFRAVVFSQFTSFMTLIETALKRENMDFTRFDGSMDRKKRAEAVAVFKSTSRKPRILIVSLKAGGVGLNLTVANHVFMMDCWWNAATENQAIDRVHRIGQEKTVYVKHYIIKDTIEGRILRIQKRKTAIVKEAFRGTAPTKEGGGESESIENLKIMFGDL